MSQPSVLLFSDDPASAGVLSAKLEAASYPTRTLGRLETVPEEANPSPAEIVVLDLPQHAPGWLAWCRDLRIRFPDCRLCVLFESAHEVEQAAALEFGADTVLVQPFSEAHLVAQLAALDRSRSGRSIDATFRVGPLAIDPSRRCATLAGASLDLTDNEFDLLHLLARNPGVILSRDSISRRLRGFPHDGRDRTIDLRVVRLRRKLGDDARRPQLIKSVRGCGYLLAPPVS